MLGADVVEDAVNRDGARETRSPVRGAAVSVGRPITAPLRLQIPGAAPRLHTWGSLPQNKMRHAEACF